MRFIHWINKLLYGAKTVKISVPQHNCAKVEPHKAHLQHVQRKYAPCSDHWCRGVK